MRWRQRGSIVVLAAAMFGAQTLAGCSFFDPMGCRAASRSADVEWNEPGAYAAFPFESNDEYLAVGSFQGRDGIIKTASWQDSRAGRGQLGYWSINVHPDDNISFLVGTDSGPPSVSDAEARALLNESFALLGLPGPSIGAWEVVWVGPGSCGGDSRDEAWVKSREEVN